MLARRSDRDPGEALIENNAGAEDLARYCTRCGRARTDPAAAFCAFCGVRFVDGSAAPAPPPPKPPVPAPTPQARRGSSPLASALLVVLLLALAFWFFDGTRVGLELRCEYLNDLGSCVQAVLH